MKAIQVIVALFLIGALGACGPKVITANENSSPEASAATSSGIFSEGSSTQTTPHTHTQAPQGTALHKVVVKEILPASRYVYLHVEENNKTFWIATRKQEIEQGGTYYYRNGLLKTQFESKEHNRIFDQIYLVSQLVSENHSQAASGTNTHTQTPSVALTENTPAQTQSWSGSSTKAKNPNSLPIAQLVKHAADYAGKSVQISGRCVKVNPNIMGKNWVHLQDGTQDDFDLVITTNERVQEGQMLTLEAVVALNRDFGAGYQYELILEGGRVLP